ncbi:SDR family oxidoreductase [Rhodococcus rhodochrous]|uniref:SDR family oxidoreductase n=1 Tax=Rhodococcus rhodochrous TaxID=1829 RepID=UPI00035C9754|nr:SDR family oxidoreductase [Rhodococcus rhodochrous]
MTGLSKFSYEGKRVIVTGAASGIGEATVDVLLSLGAEVHSMDVKEAAKGIFTHLDLSDEESIERAVEAVGGPVHALFNIAGLGSYSPVGGDLVLLVNFVGTRYLTDCVVPLMPPGSAIANVTSRANRAWRDNVDEVRPLIETDSFEAGAQWIAEHPESWTSPAPGPNGTAYRFSKDALTVYTMLKAQQLRPLGIRVNSQSPNGTKSGLYSNFVASVGDAEKAVEMTVGEGGRAGEAEEQAYALAFLNSDAASFVSGIDLGVDGAGGVAKEYKDAAVLPPLASAANAEAAR